MIFLRRREIVRHPAGNHHKLPFGRIKELIKDVFWAFKKIQILILEKKSSSKVVNLLKRMDRYKEGILKLLFTTDVPFDNNLAKESTENVQS